VKIDGFKLNIDNVESLNKILNIVFIKFSKKIYVYFNARNFFAF